MENHFIETGKLFFSSQPISLFHKIITESLLSGKKNCLAELLLDSAELQRISYGSSVKRTLNVVEAVVLLTYHPCTKHHVLCFRANNPTSQTKTLRTRRLIANTLFSLPSQLSSNVQIKCETKVTSPESFIFIFYICFANFICFHPNPLPDACFSSISS